MAFTPRTWGHQHHRLAPRRQPPPAAGRLPRLEVLEDRTVLSPLIVTNNTDNPKLGSGSLRATIAAATPGATIVFAPNVHNITLTSELIIAKNLDIEGPGANGLTISGGGVSRVFEISGGIVTIAGLTITDGLTTSTYTISEQGVVTSGELGGGGILNDAGATLNLTRCSVVNNKAIADTGFDVFGGGLLNLGTANVTSSTFTGNFALGGLAGAGGKDGQGSGGGLYITSGADVVLSPKTKVNGNRASTSDDNIFP